MDAVANGLAENNYVVSIANFGGVIAFIVLLVGFTRWAYRFGKATYRQNIRVAFQRARRRNYLSARRAAVDLHTFIGLIVLWSIILLFAAMTSIVGIVAWSTRSMVRPEDKLSTALNVSPAWDTVAAL